MGGYGNDDPVKRYIEEIARVPRLSEAAELTVRERAAAGDGESMQLLVEVHRQLVIPIAKEYANRGLGLLDLIQAGNIGLVRAAVKLNELATNQDFGDVATASIRQFIEEELNTAPA